MSDRDVDNHRHYENVNDLDERDAKTLFNEAEPRLGRSANVAPKCDVPSIVLLVRVRRDLFVATRFASSANQTIRQDATALALFQERHELRDRNVKNRRSSPFITSTTTPEAQASCATVL